MVTPKYHTNWDHLRVCGADYGCQTIRNSLTGSSPRVRSRPSRQRHRTPVLGIISACAEQTLCNRCRSLCSWDHLRVCGADNVCDGHSSAQDGSSPRVRSRRSPQFGCGLIAGIISACAEQTGRQGTSDERCEDHLRVCGADGVDRIRDVLPEGSSPRVRSRQ